MSNPQSDSPAVASSASAAHRDLMRKQVRGSALLLSGRCCALAMNLITQIVIVRALSMTEYGHLAYAVAIVEVLSTIGLFALDKTVLRYCAIYHEQHDLARFAGSLVISVASPACFGLAFLIGLLTAGDSISQLLGFDSVSQQLLLVLALLIPANGFASVSLSLITVIKGARSVYFRKHLLSPLLKLILVSSAAFMSSKPTTLAAALMIAGIVGLLIDMRLISRLLTEENLIPYFKPSRIMLPIREFVSYGLPVVASDLSFMVRSTLLVFLLGWIGNTEDTARLRSVLPLVRLNELVVLNFMVLFVPTASRLFASGKLEQLWETHRQSNLWIMTLSFPVFAATTALARPLTVTMFGAAYADAAILLVILSTGYYIQAVYGLNGHVLRVLGRVKLLLAADIAGGLILLGLALSAIPRWGALGAAVSAAVGIVVHSQLRTMAVLQVKPRGMASTTSRIPTLITLAVTAAVAYLSAIWTPGWIVGSALATLASALVLTVNRRRLNVDQTFPEFRRIPLLNRILPQEGLHETHRETPRRIAYVMSRFPKITETFILREMVEAERLGVEVLVYPLQREKTKIVHPQAVHFVKHARFTPWLSVGILRANLITAARTPVRYAHVFCQLIQSNWGSARYLAGAILFFPKVVYMGERMVRDGVHHLHAHFASHPAMAAWVIHRLWNIPYSFTAHGSDLHRDRHMLREKVAASTRTVTISEYNRNLILCECGDEYGEKVHVIHCGINPAEFPVRTEPTSFARHCGPLQIICIGTLHEVKGQQHLLKACQILRSEGLEFCCHFVGDGPDLEFLKELTARLEISLHVVFHGRMASPEIQTLLADIDVIVAPSVPTNDGRREGIPVVLMEGLATGIPAIASDLSGIPELVQHEQTGLLTPPGDEQAIANALIRMATDERLRTRCGEAGSGLVLSDFHVVTNTHTLLHLLEHGRPPESLQSMQASSVEQQFETETSREESCLTPQR